MSDFPKSLEPDASRPIEEMLAPSKEAEVTQMLEGMDPEVIAKAQKGMGMDKWVELREEFAEDAEGLRKK